MKRAGFFAIPLFFLLLSNGSSFADNTQTGNANSQATVETNVQGNGNVTTHIETSNNGQTNVIDTQGNGQINVTNNNGNVTVTKTPQVTIVQMQTVTSTPTPTALSKVEGRISFVTNLMKDISNFLKRIIRNL